jgi:hypothetical protein
LGYYIERRVVVDVKLKGEKTRLNFTLERRILNGRARTVCSDMLTHLAHSKVERGYCYSDSEWLSYFLYIAKRKGIPIVVLKM